MKNTFLAVSLCRFATLAAVFLVGGLTHHAIAQTVTLQQDAFYPDTAICHTGVPVRFVGRVSFASYPANTAYSITVHYGDGATQTFTKNTGNAVSGSDTFVATHAYTTPGSWVVKAFAQTNAGTATDSIVRTWNVGGCSGKVSGRVFYDCIQNCTPDTGELGLRNRYISFTMNSTPRALWTDATGGYSSPLFPGDTLKRPAGPIDLFQASVTAACPYAPAFASDTNKHVAVRLSQPIALQNVVWPDKVCKIPTANPSYVKYEVDRYGAMQYDWLTRISLGDGSPLYSYYNGAALQLQSDFLAYQTAGTYIATLWLHNENFYGPVMEMKHTIIVDTCKDIRVRLFADHNADCNYQTAEVPIQNQALTKTSQMFGTQQVATNDTGIITVSVWEGDTVTFPDASIEVYSWGPYDTLTAAACTPVSITQATASTVPLAFKPKMFFSGPADLSHSVCLNQPQSIDVPITATGIPAGLPIRIRGIYSDGGLDTNVLSAPAIPPGTSPVVHHSFYLTHRWQSVPASVMYVLEAPGMTPDTITGTAAINGGCWATDIRAFKDANRNCMRDTAEPWVLDFEASTGGTGGTAYSFPNGIATAILSAAVPSVTSITIPSGSPGGLANYTAAATAPFCTWPAVPAPGGTVALPLIDTPTFLSSIGFPNPPAACTTVVDASVGLLLLPNYSARPYRVTYHFGDGTSTSQTFNLTTTNSFGFFTGPHTYAAGSYTPVVSVYDSVLGQTVYTYTLPQPLVITDTCTGFKGRLFADANANCVFNAPGDAPLAGIAVSGTKNGAAFNVMTDAAGRFRVPAVSGDALVVNVPPSVNGRALACSTAASYIYTMAGAAVHKPFAYACDTQSAAQPDVSLLAGHGVWAPGGVDTLRLYPSGMACEDSAALMHLSLAPELTFISSSLPGATVFANTATWAVPSIAALPQMIKVAVSVAPGAVVGSWICASASLQSAMPDSFPGNNNFLLCDSVKAAVPNFYKTASSDSMTAQGALLPGRPIIYTLGFTNNTGDTVHHIVLLDTLSPLLNPSTAQMLSASHTHTAQFVGGDVLKITMSSLNLLPGAKGYASFSVQPVASLLPGNAVPNTASVLFGGLPAAFMSVVVSNPDTAATNGVAAAVAMADDILLFPVPADEEAMLQSSLPAWINAGFEVTDARGARMMHGRMEGGRARWSVASWAPGLYVVRVWTEGRIVVRKLVVR